jgi:hypothetical protein
VDNKGVFFFLSEMVQKKRDNDEFELLIPDLMYSVWKYDQRNIAKMLKGACLKLLLSKV